MGDLLPCPFCGGTAELVEEHDHCWVRHDGCPVQPDAGGFERAEDARAAWNSRHGALSSGALGVSRLADNSRALLISFRGVPSDDDIRRLHDFLAKEEQPLTAVQKSVRNGTFSVKSAQSH
jgi:hypothetical protein